MDSKRAAGRYAADLVDDGQAIGLGTGSTVAFALERLAERIQHEGLRIACVATSKDTEHKARRLGIPLSTLAAEPRLSVTVDGADEVGPDHTLIKGGGGALVREKIVAAASQELIVIVSESKMVETLGKAFLLPVEFLPFAQPLVQARLQELGLTPYLRTGEDDEPFITDNGNAILDCACDGIEDPETLEREINLIPGVLDNGLFVGMAGRIVIGKQDGSVEVRD
jgi:ribose 5-phosphate isomerase A